jgi:hypothetical protein
LSIVRRIYRAITGSGEITTSKHHEYGNQFQTLICSFQIPRCLEQDNEVSVTSELPQIQSETILHRGYHLLDGTQNNCCSLIYWEESKKKL